MCSASHLPKRLQVHADEQTAALTVVGGPRNGEIISLSSEITTIETAILADTIDTDHHGEAVDTVRQR